MLRAAAVLAAAALVTAPAFGADTGRPENSARATTFKNCTALNRVYRHGVGRSGAIDRVSSSGRPVTTFTRNNAVYAANAKSVRDGDKIACEKR